jgi:hypothetical protein
VQDAGVQQQAERIDENVPLLTLDQLAGVKAVRINVGPPLYGAFFVKEFQEARPIFLPSFLCSI